MIHKRLDTARPAYTATTDFGTSSTLLPFSNRARQLETIWTLVSQRRFKHECWCSPEKTTTTNKPLNKRLLSCPFSIHCLAKIQNPATTLRGGAASLSQVSAPKQGRCAASRRTKGAAHHASIRKVSNGLRRYSRATSPLVAFAASPFGVGFKARRNFSSRSSHKVRHAPRDSLSISVKPERYTNTEKHRKALQRQDTPRCDQRALTSQLEFFSSA